MQERITRESMVFYESFYEATKDLPPEEFKKCICGIINYGLYGIAPETTGIEKTIYVLSKPQIDKNNQRWINSKSRQSKINKIPEPCAESTEAAEAADEKESAFVSAEEDFEEQIYENVSETVPQNKEPEAEREPGTAKRTDENMMFYEGTYKNVRLTLSEKLRIINEIGIVKYVDCVKYLSEYIKSNPGYDCDDALSDILGWVKERVDGVSLSG